MTARSRARPALRAPPWLAAAAEAFCRAPPLPRPALYGTPPRRDVIGWVASLLLAPHTQRWLTLCAALRMHCTVGEDADEVMEGITCRVIEFVVLPLQEGETKRVLTTNLRRHVRRGLTAGLTFMHVFDFYLALFDLEEGLHSSVVAVGGETVEGDSGGEATSSTSSLATLPWEGSMLTASPGAELDDDSDAIMALLEEDIFSSCSGGAGPLQEKRESRANGGLDAVASAMRPANGIGAGGGVDVAAGVAAGGEIIVTDAGGPNGTVVNGSARTQLPPWVDIFALKFLFNKAVEKFRIVHTAVGTRHVREMIEKETGTYSWARGHAVACGLDDGQARVVHLVVQKGSSCEGEVTLIRSHFTVFRENDPLVFAAELSTLDPKRAILVADSHVGLTVQDSIARSRSGTMMRLTPGRSASNIRKLMYADALCQRRNSGTITQEAFMHLVHKLTMLNSGLGEGTPGSTWADIWPNWPPLDTIDKEVLEGRYICGNIVAGALLAATTLANSIEGVGEISEYEYASAMQRLKMIADLGDAVAPNYIGLALSQAGPGMNIAEATRYYRMAVDRGNKNAPAMLGNLLLAHGRDDPVDCLDLFKLSVARGGRYGHRFLADLLMAGAPGIQADAGEAWRLYEEAARLGDPVAKCKIEQSPAR